MLPPRVLRIQMSFTEFMNKPWLRPRHSASSAKITSVVPTWQPHWAQGPTLLPPFLPLVCLEILQEIQRNEQRYKQNKNKQRCKQI